MTIYTDKVIFVDLLDTYRKRNAYAQHARFQTGTWFTPVKLNLLKRNMNDSHRRELD
ncbi:MAG TPA: hypothetical protein IAD15_05890 [Candidatus Fimiplasma intestinipullorum]|uniref:Uncharacterized protein n=1 Tax=Candidatus Fimiplasma intestinipullorum TaxID=2840825 RepID=A0A9D1L0B3_9FIRM|nr:hypothetical protein [Candidatus Fimiplasma intestinipullorum]